MVQHLLLGTESAVKTKPTLDQQDDDKQQMIKELFCINCRGVAIHTSLFLTNVLLNFNINYQHY